MSRVYPHVRPALASLNVSPTVRRNLWFIVAQFAPMLVLSYVFIQINPVLESTHVGSMRVFEIMVIASVLSPLVSQTVSGPIFRAYDELRVRNRATYSATTLHALPKTFVVGTPTLIIVVGIAAVVKEWSTTDFMIVLAAVGLNVCFAAAMTSAYATRSAGTLMSGWITYAMVLWVAPVFWFMAPIVAATVLIVVMVRRSRGAEEIGRTTFVRAVFALVRSLADAIPLWIVPLTVYLYGVPVTMTMLLLFIALIPALLTYQIYFVSISDPTWRNIDAFKQSITLTTHTEVRAEGLRLRKMSRAGTIGAFMLAVGTTLLFVPWLIDAGVPALDRVLLFAVTLAGVAAVVLLAQINRLAMAGSEILRYAVPLALLAAITTALIAGASLTGALLIYAMSCGALSVVVAIVNRVMWHSPEYTLFWAKAIRQ